MSRESLNEWKQQYWRLLIDKCILAHVTLADLSKKTSPITFEDCLSHLQMAALLWIHLDQKLPAGECCSASAASVVQTTPLQSYALSIAGDLYFLIVQQWNQLSIPARKGFDGSDLQLLNLIGITNISTREVDFPFPSSLLHALELSVTNYRLALSALSVSFQSQCSTEIDYRNEMERISLTKRLGNACNELGVFYMSKAAGKTAFFKDLFIHSIVDLFIFFFSSDGRKCPELESSVC